MKKILLATAIGVSLLSGCASVPLASKAETNTAKEFKTPVENTAGIYIYRVDSAFGAALKKDVWVNGECIGETAPGVFFYHEVKSGEDYTISTESEFSANEIKLNTESGKSYFYEQYIKMGAFSGGAGLKVVDNEIGKSEVSKLPMATKGKCSTKA